MKHLLTAIFLFAVIVCYGQFKIGHNAHKIQDKTDQSIDPVKTDSLSNTPQLSPFMNEAYDGWAKELGIKDELIENVRVISVEAFPFFNQSMLTPMSIQLEFWFKEGNMSDGVYVINFTYPSKTPIHIKEGSRLWIGLAKPSTYPEAIHDYYSEEFGESGFRYIIKASFAVSLNDFSYIARESGWDGVDRIMFIKTVKDLPLAQKEFIYSQNIEDLGDYLSSKDTHIQMYLLRYK